MVSQQILKSLHVTNLKSIRDLDIYFEGYAVTAILGPNGNGKSTVLHALACAFRPVDEGGEDYKFSNFFLPHPDALWQGSSMSIVYQYRDGAALHKDMKKAYGKKIDSDRWTPRYVNRPERNVIYIGVDTCVPLIESEKKQFRLRYSTSRVNEQTIQTVLQKASYVLNRHYTAYNEHDAGSGKKFCGVEAEGLRYSALSMSAGEQKVFNILEKVFRAKKYSLILVDEIDLLLHDLALQRLVEVVSECAEKQSLQVVFTTHRETVAGLPNVNVRHLFNTPEKTLCFEDTKPDSIARLTGKQLRSIEVFVEDDVARSMVRKVATQLGMARHVSISLYGAAWNCFPLVSGLLLSGADCDRCLFVLDGDVFSSDEEVESAIGRVLTGNDVRASGLREKAQEKITKFDLPAGCSPEQYLHRLLVRPSNGGNGEDLEIVDVAKGVGVMNDSHLLVDTVIERLGFERDVGLSKIVDLASAAPEWDRLVYAIRERLRLWKEVVEESDSMEAQIAP